MFVKTNNLLNLQIIEFKLFNYKRMANRKFMKLLKTSGLLLLTFLLSSCQELIILNSKGPVGQSQAKLIIIAFALMLIVVIPVFVMVVLFSVKYRKENTHATYKPTWAHSTTIEWIIWIVPVSIIIVLAYLTWTSTYELDPYKPIVSENKALEVEVISTDWNWVFVYPEYNIATVNELTIEAGRPISFKLTSASVMTSFFIPQLGSQIYAMAGMQTKLNLHTDHPGVYRGQNMEYSGNGYGTMYFHVKATTGVEFNSWVKSVQLSTDTLSMDKFNEIKVPHINHPVSYFVLGNPNIFMDVMMPYMQWMNHGCHDGMNHENMNHETMEEDADCHTDVSESEKMQKDSASSNEHSCH